MLSFVRLNVVMLSVVAPYVAVNIVSINLKQCSFKQESVNLPSQIFFCENASDSDREVYCNSLGRCLYMIGSVT
jgi:hypothetical protein